MAIGNNSFHVEERRADLEEKRLKVEERRLCIEEERMKIARKKHNLFLLQLGLLSNAATATCRLTQEYTYHLVCFVLMQL